jgi:YVTN family beta-propeller protein
MGLAAWPAPFLPVLNSRPTHYYSRVKSLPSCLLLLCLALAGCQVSLVPSSRVRLDDEGVVYLYLQPLVREAERLQFTIEGITAVSRDGSEVSLGVALRDAKGPELRRQRLLAAGPLPAGDYSGFVVRTGKASLKSDEGSAALLPPEAPARIEFGFTVRRGQGTVVFLALRYAESVAAGFRFSPAFAAFAPDRPAVGSLGFVVNSRSSDVTVFDKRAMQVVGVIATGRKPSGVALDQTARKLYVALSGEDRVEVVDAMSMALADQIRLSPGDEPVALALAPDGATLLSANLGSNTVSIMDTASRVERAKVPVGSGPRSITVDRMRRRAFVFSATSNTVSVLDIASGAAIRSISTYPGPVRGDFNRRGDSLYVIHEASAWVTVINPLTLTVTGRFPVRSSMAAIKVDPGTDLVYLAGRGEPTVGLHEPFSFVPVNFVATDAGVVHMATDGEANTLYLVMPDANRVLVVDRISKRTVGELDVGEGPTWITLMGEN